MRCLSRVVRNVGKNWQPRLNVYARLLCFIFSDITSFGHQDSEEYREDQPFLQHSGVNMWESKLHVIKEGQNYGAMGIEPSSGSTLRMG